MLDFPEIQGGQVFQAHNTILWSTILLLLLLLELLLLELESVLHLLLHRTHFLLKGVILLTHHHHLLLRIATSIPTHSRWRTAARLQLLLLHHILYKCLLIHCYSMLLLEFISIIVQECLISGHLVPDRHQVDLIDGLLNTHRLYGK